MIVGINGSFLRKRDSGIGQVSWNFLKKLIEIHKSINDIQFIIYLEEDVELDLPRGFERKIILPSYKRDDLLRKLLWEKFVLPKEARKYGCDVFFSLYQSASIIPGIPHLMLVHDGVWKVFPEYLSNLRKKIYYYFVEKAILRANKILTVSEHSKKDIVEFFEINKKKVSVAQVDCDSIFKREVHTTGRESLEEYGIAGDYIFYIGGFDIRKNVSKLIWSYGDFWMKYHNELEIPDLILGGNFHEHLFPLVDNIPEEIKKTSEEFGVPVEKIKMIGFVSQEKLPDLYLNSRMFCYPSLYEGFGIPVLEAMSVGCPVITSNISSISEIANSQNAFIVNPENVEEISDAMYEVLIDKNKVQEKVVQAKNDSRKFSWSKFTQKVLEEISSI